MKTKLSKWIPKKEFFERLKAGTLPVNLQEKYSSKRKRVKSKKKRIKRIKGRRVKSGGPRRFKSKKQDNTLYNFTIYSKGEVVQTIEGKKCDIWKIEKTMQKRYNDKNILISKEKI